LDRFFMKLRMAFPTRDEIHVILDRTTQLDEPAVERVWDAAKILELRDVALGVPISDAVQDYAVRLIMATQPSTPAAHALTKQYIRYGSSPRGVQTVIVAAKVRALLAGHTEVRYDDIRTVALPSLRHRVILSFEGVAAGIDADDVLTGIIESVPE